MKTMTATNILSIFMVSFLAASCLAVDKIWGAQPEPSFRIDEARSFGGYIAYDYSHPLFQGEPDSTPPYTEIIVNPYASVGTNVAEAHYDFPWYNLRRDARYKVVFRVEILTGYSETTWIDIMSGQGDHYMHEATYSFRGDQDESQNELQEKEQERGVIRATPETKLSGGTETHYYTIEGGVFVPGQFSLENGIHTRLLRIQTTSKRKVYVYIAPALVKLD